MRLSDFLRVAKTHLKRNIVDKSGGIKWVCCSDPERTTTRSGVQVWKAYCMWKKGSKHGAMPRVVLRPKKDPDNPDRPGVLGPKPTRIILKGKTIKRC